MERLNEYLKVVFTTKENEYFRFYTECKVYFTCQGIEKFVGYAPHIYPQMDDNEILDMLIGKVRDYSELVKRWENAK